MAVWLFPLFALTALLYASVGFGGGSTYTALLALSEQDHRILPLVSLACNLLVTSGSVWYFWKSGLYRNSRLAPIVMASVPASFLGGLTPISAMAFHGLLGALLLIAGTNMLVESFRRSILVEQQTPAASSSIGAAACGLIIGYVSGLAGIGGGIFLAPILHKTGWDTPKRIAAAASLFIAANSAAALTGKFISLGDMALAADAFARNWPLAIAVLAGGAFGRRVLTSPVPERAIKAGTAALILYVAWKILLKWWQAFA